ncbi:hypothetical protein ES703_75227 [subsurface metagenome]
MTGSGTLLDPYVIYDVNDLQAMENDLAAYYELGQDIDASATLGWGGLGFNPVGEVNNYIISRPSGDYSSSGFWTIYPADEVMWDKVDEETPDDDATYIKAWQDGCRVLFSFPTIDLPKDAVNISVRVYSRMTDVSTLTVKPSLRVGGNTYDVGDGFKVYEAGWRTSKVVIGKNPKTGLDWTIDDIEGVGANALEAFGVLCLDASIRHVKFTQIYIRVEYDLPFQGHFDGKGYTIDKLFINRPTEDYVGYALGATIQNAKLTNATITGDMDTGVLAGALSFTTVTNVEAIAANVVGGWCTGGLAGEDQGIISNCRTSGTISADDYDVGGLIGAAFGVYEDCVSSCTITGTYGSQKGGLIGGFWGFYGGKVRRCSASGDVSGDEELGGLIGYSDEGIVEEECFATGDVSAQRFGGTGGLVGTAYDTEISKSYATGDVTTVGGWGVGGFPSSAITCSLP